ncbi:MAG TPA: hypothetical protein VK390_17970, partial [Propionibacteriaceae bacterium]|nr:hypothetical protein [Propionibacteriaceae bacterium]
VYLVPCRANSQPAFGSYLAVLDEPIARPAGLIVLSLAADHIAALTRFHADDLYPKLRLPAFVQARSLTGDR